MSKPPAFSMYASDWFTDTAEFKSCERGVYINLLCCQWVNGDLPNDLERLAGIAIEPLDSFLVIWEIIKHKFVERNGRLINLRLEESRGDKQRFLQGAINGGKASAASRKKKTIEVKHYWDTDTFKAAWERWKKYKKDSFKFHFKTADSEQTNLESLFKRAKDEKTAIEWINNSIEKQWQGIYEPYGIKKDNGKTFGKKDFGAL